ncbi:MAG: 4'-phosphopantetheinyl transferase superfamily protein [Chlamydiia bacterium]|nr:4'-phosphopantetheinyl transferase superfamily protein [Chlamydiia bacterium]
MSVSSDRIQPLKLEKLKKVELFFIDLENITSQEAEDAKQFLDQESLNKCLRYVNKEDQQKSLITHAFLHHLLSKKVGIAPSRISLKRTSYGKPYLEGFPIHFNLSHTKHAALIAFHSSPIGVDIEAIDPSRVLQKTPTINPSEQEVIDQSEDPVDTFFSYWCAKEALLKAKGTGLSCKNYPYLEFSSHSTCHYMNDTIHLLNKANAKLAVCLI